MTIERPEPPRTGVVRVSRASLYLPREICDAYFSGLQSVALLSREQHLLILPLMAGSAGGLLLKQRNGRGDRVIHAQEFFREHGYVEDFDTRDCPVTWNPESAALVISGVPRVSRAPVP